MIIVKSILFLSLLILPSNIVFTQSTTNTYNAYQISVPYVTTCSSNQYYDIALLQCSACPDNAVQKSTDNTQCECTDTSYYYAVNQGGGSLLCSKCASGFRRSTDGFGCTLYSSSCATSTESNLDGSLYSSNFTSTSPRYTGETCQTCVAGAWSDPDNQRCTPCAIVTPHIGSAPTNISCCALSDVKDGMCLTYIINTLNIAISPIYNNRFNSPTVSSFFKQHLDASLYLCLMNLNNNTAAQTTNRTLLSNATACQVLANIVAMQFYYPVNNYAYNLYQNYIWTPASSSVWSASEIRTSIPFLAYPSTYYQEINSASYNWIPASSSTQNNLIRYKLAKYSPTGKYIGLFDAFDAYLQLCGSSYTDGRPAFTFGTQYKKACNIRVDALWFSTLYDTAFYDPYILFTQSGTDYMLPTPVVIKNYKANDSSSPNQNDDESQWVYHRRFFLIDRISGILDSTGELNNIHYAKSIKIVNTLTNSAANIQPPLIIIEYGELAISDTEKGSLVEITFETQYRMNLDTHISSIWIAVGVLCGLGFLLSLIETRVWYSRAGKIMIDLGTIGKFFLYLINSIGTIFFIVMAGVSLWWLIFFKRQDAIYLVIPTTIQQTSFTVLVVVAFVLKTLDILHLIIRQSNIDIFFIDWEKSKSGNPNTISVWRSYFVANEYSEIQTFRRINVTFQIIFVLLLLKVINLENVATIQPGVNLFPSSTDYVPAYNGILRVGIAFSMWLGVALIQYLIYILFYQRFVQDKIINFLDLCSVSNISVFILMDNLYGYYMHGRSPHGTADVNMKEMMTNLERESNQKIGTRGLQPNSDDQTFIIRVDKAFRSQYELLLKNYQNRILTRLTKKGDEHECEILLASYRNLNEFLCAFINQSLPTYSYSIRPRVFLEKILNCELRFRNTPISQEQTESIFYIDLDRNFTKTLFAGYENSLFIWNTATFLFIDYFAMNYVLAAIITYFLNLIAGKLRVSLGQRNLSKKTLIPKNFLV
ncbi:unnamed protein product [Adineta steineri]|uniref:Meckelin n=3 Tax=Adineta steineri TaxID=433720 RepID=A0A815GVS3_9BILA|nr:unnamed protein product [Adineta steineri]